VAKKFRMSGDFPRSAAEENVPPSARGSVTAGTSTREAAGAAPGRASTKKTAITPARTARTARIGKIRLDIGCGEFPPLIPPLKWRAVLAKPAFAGWAILVRAGHEASVLYFVGGASDTSSRFSTGGRHSVSVHGW
jgi:hypothetical protein